MWDWWKKILKSLDLDKKEIVEAIEPAKQNNREHHIHAKMTYQYPEKAPFRFPVIPDEQRKRPVRSVRPVRPHTKHTMKQEKKELHEEQGDSKQVHKVKNTEKKPFAPTQVASPIYGYGKRDKEVETVPAYVRKRQKKDGPAWDIHHTADIQSSLTPLKKVAETPVLQIKEKQPTSEMESSVVHLENDEQNIMPAKEEKNEGTPALVLAEEEAAATLAEKDESFVDIKEHVAELKHADVIPETSIELEQNDNQLDIENDGVIEKKWEKAADALNHRVQDHVIEELLIEEESEKTEENGIPSAHVPAEQAEHKQEQTKPLIEKRQSFQNQVLKSVTETDRKSNERLVPFNVIMTPQDKLLHKLHREQKAKEEQRKRVPEPKKDIYIPHHLLNDPVPDSSEDELWLKDQQELLEKTLKYFNVQAKVVNVTQGPTVTRFEVQPELGVKVSKVRNLSDDIKLNMAAKDIRIEAPIPGKNTIGIEVPNLNSHMVGLQEIFETDDFKKNDSPLTIGLGLSVEGLPIISDISKMPHGLIAGATGSGKSVCINTILLSILYKASHKDVKLLLIDPKMVELAPYNGLPHLVSPVITDVKAATAALKWAVEEMEERYEKFVKEGVRDIGRYNRKLKEQFRYDEKMPYIVIVIDELADLMMASPQDVEDSICRIAQKARACGIHLLLATQRPSVDVITGLIKANVPTRIAFSVSSQVDSRTIIDMNGAERLLGKGDMLFIENGASKSIRLQGAFVSDEEIERITNYVRKMAPPHYLFEPEQLIQMEMSEVEDELLDSAIQFVIRQNQASTSLLQRQFRIGYNRAARLIDTLESRGIISGQNGSKPRDVLLSKTQVEDMYP